MYQMIAYVSQFEQHYIKLQAYIFVIIKVFSVDKMLLKMLLLIKSQFLLLKDYRLFSHNL